jgi:hypothetical protein
VKAPAVIGDEKNWELGIYVVGMHKKKGSIVYGAPAPKVKVTPLHNYHHRVPEMHMYPTLQAM